MDDQHSLIHIDSLLFQLALQCRELSQKKDDINQQIKVGRADIAERRSYIETTRINIKTLEEEINVKQNTVEQIKANAKSMRATNSLLLQYEKMLKAELERRQENYNQDMKVYEERIASYKEVFQQHREYYCQNPLAKKLLTVQAEKEEIECRIKACEDQITMKQNKLENLVDQTVNSSSTDNPPESISGQLTVEEPGKHFNHQTEEDIHSDIDISSLNLAQTMLLQNAHKMSGEANAEETHEKSIAQNTPSSTPPPEEANPQLWSNQESVEQRQQSDQMPSADHDQQSGPEEQKEHSTLSVIEEAMEEGMEETEAVQEEQALFITGEEDNEGAATFSQTSPPRTDPQSPPARMKVVPSTPTFSLNSSPGSSPGRGPSDGKSPAFLFSMNSDPSTPSFSEFGFDMGSAQEEDSPFTFTSSYFSDKKTNESKSSSGKGFLFGQAERSEEEFKFSFAPKSPEPTTADQDNTAEDTFPFSFNFGKF